MAVQVNFVEIRLLPTARVHHSRHWMLLAAHWSYNIAVAGGTLSFTTHDSRSNDRGLLIEDMTGARLADFLGYKPQTSGDVQPPLMPLTRFYLPPIAP